MRSVSAMLMNVRAVLLVMFVASGMLIVQASESWARPKIDGLTDTLSLLPTKAESETIDLTHPATPEWLNCRFGYKYHGGPRTGACMPYTLEVRPGDTVGGIAERLGHYSRWGELCYYPDPRRVGARHARVRLPGEFNVRRIFPGDYVGGCA